VSTGPDGATARSRWQEVQDELLRGITHALSNRVATLSAAAYMLEFGDVTPAQAAESMRTESERIDELLQLLRRLPAREEPEPEPVSPGELVEDAVALHAFHCDLRDVPVEVAVAADVLPVLVEPHALRQALLLALSAAKRTAVRDANGHLPAARIDVRGDAEVVHIHVHGVANGAAVDADAVDTDAVDATRAREFAAMRACLGTVRGAVQPLADGGCVVQLPSLLAARRDGY
jgi:C4-dicarboxylate-specific signal transduction histidine kinase